MKFMHKFEIEIINYLEQEGLVAEIYYDSVQWVEIIKNKKATVIKFHSHPDKECWEFSCEDAIKVLEQAKTKLLMRSNKGSFVEKMIPPDPQQVNEVAEKILEEIVNHPEKKMIQGQLQRFGNVVDIYEPSGRGARYSAAGEFIGFLE
ncbi:MAG: hypothetical protein K1000chlam2_01487 [Chlamydiae bacterium]|nr:hypothetical protein [Chlamydiota bacterium]